MYIDSNPFGRKIMHDICNLRGCETDFFKFFVVSKNFPSRTVIWDLTVVHNDQAICISGYVLHTVGDKDNGYSSLFV